MTDPGQDLHLSEPQRRVLDTMLDELIPPNPTLELPGAGSLGIGAEVTAAMESQPAALPLIQQGLNALKAANLSQAPASSVHWHRRGEIGSSRGSQPEFTTTTNDSRLLSRWRWWRWI